MIEPTIATWILSIVSVIIYLPAVYIQTLAVWKPHSQKVMGCLPLVLALISSSLFAEDIHKGAVRTSRPPRQTTYFDCERQLRTLSADLQALHEAGKTTAMETLVKQLARSRCNIHLSGPPASTVAPSTLFEQKKKAVLILGSLYKCSKCSKWHVSIASGFLVTASGVMITNYHVVDGPDNAAMGAMTYDGRVYPVKEVLAADRSSDVAVLQLEGSGFPYLSLSPGAAVGEKVWVISHPRKQLFMFTEGIISGFFVKTWKGDKTARMTITADFGRGSSGAPVFNGSGGVVGMVASTLPVQVDSKCSHDYAQMIVGHCIPSEYILELFSGKEGGDTAGSAEPKPEGDVTEGAHQACR